MSPALDQALKLLGHHARSEAQLRHRLEAKGFAAEEIDAAIARLKELRYLDDQAFAESKALAMVNQEGKGPALAVRKLEAAGIDEGQAELAVQQARDGMTEHELALKALERRRPVVGPDSALAERIKAARWLAGRGFSEETVHTLLRLDEG